MKRLSIISLVLFITGCGSGVVSTSPTEARAICEERLADGVLTDAFWESLLIVVRTAGDEGLSKGDALQYAAITCDEPFPFEDKVDCLLCWTRIIDSTW